MTSYIGNITIIYIVVISPLTLFPWLNMAEWLSPYSEKLSPLSVSRDHMVRPAAPLSALTPRCLTYCIGSVQ